MISPITTRRLRLVSLSTEVLRLLFDKDVVKANEQLCFEVSESSSILGFSWLKKRLKLIESDASQHPWMYRAIIREKDNQMVGFISFHHKAPDPDLREYSSNGAELGYTIESELRRQGYAKESILGMIEWAKSEHGITDMFVTISPENMPSMKLAEALKFVKIGDHQDPIDGLEYVMKYPLIEHE